MKWRPPTSPYIMGGRDWMESKAVRKEAAVRDREAILRLDVVPPRLPPLRVHAVEEALLDTRTPEAAVAPAGRGIR
jgi:hypothetical protein